jgi:hypothetical protein
MRTMLPKYLKYQPELDRIVPPGGATPPKELVRLPVAGLLPLCRYCPSCCLVVEERKGLVMPP